MEKSSIVRKAVDKLKSLKRLPIRFVGIQGLSTSESGTVKHTALPGYTCFLIADDEVQGKITKDASLPFNEKLSLCAVATMAFNVPDYYFDMSSCSDDDEISATVSNWDVLPLNARALFRTCKLLNFLYGG